jgi:PAT family beta-lactamase induction signal transducer AmpG
MQSLFSKLLRGVEICANRRLLVTLFLGFSSGLPIALCSSTLQAWFTVAGINLMTIGALTLVQYPYALKWIWSPLLDRFVPPFLGRRRGWILLMQVALAVTIATMAFQNPKLNPWLISLLALLVAFFSATQDIGIDAYRTDVLKPNERGIGAAMVTGGYRIAMLVSGGLALVAAAVLGWRATYLLMAGLMLFGVFITLLAPDPEFQEKPPTTLAKAIVEPFKEFMSRDSAVVILIFIVIYKLSDALALALGTTFLIRGVGFSLADVGAIYKVVGMTATLLGAFVGGGAMMRIGMYRSLLYFGILQALSNLTFMALAIVGKSYTLMVFTIFAESFCGGLGTVALVAFLMSLCDCRYTATQFALLSALSSVGRIFVGPLASYMVEHLGWAQFYFWTTVVAIPSFFLLWILRHHIAVVQEILSPMKVE